MSPHGRHDRQQNDYFNTVLLLRNRLSADALLAVLKKIEHGLGRRRAPRGSARRIDLDLLLHGDQTVETPELTLPHPRLLERDFVLIPLQEIAGEWAIPETNSGATLGAAAGPTTVDAACAALGAAELERLVWPDGPPIATPLTGQQITGPQR